MMKYRFTLAIACLLFLNACQNDDSVIVDDSPYDDDLENVLKAIAPDNSLAYFQMPDSDDFAAIPQDPKNPITKEKVELGKLLYHETALAINPEKAFSKGTYSCASCHFAGAGFQAGRFQGLGDGGLGFGINGEGRVKGALYPDEMIDVQPIRTPTAMNGAYQINQLWNGQFGATGLNEGTQEAWAYDTPIETNFLGYEGLETQAIAGLKVHRLDIDMNVLGTLGYQDLFDVAFPEINEENRYTREYAGLAIAAYERTMFSNQAPFQEWLKGDKNAMTDTEKEGAILFFETAQCASCHTGPALNSMEFHALGMHDLFSCGEEVFQSSFASNENKGRGGFTGKQEDMYHFKVPQLYNLADSPFYGHGSSFRSIKDVIKYKNEAIHENPVLSENMLSEGFHPLNLSDSEIDAITAFLSSALHDPNLDRYVPNEVLSGNCFPFADPLAAHQLGCE